MLFGAPVHQGSALFAKAVHGKGWAGAVAQQPLQGGTVVGFDAHTGVDREAAVLVGQHLFGVTTLQQTPAHEGAQNAPTQIGLHLDWSQWALANPQLRVFLVRSVASAPDLPNSLVEAVPSLGSTEVRLAANPPPATEGSSYQLWIGVQDTLGRRYFSRLAVK